MAIDKARLNRLHRESRAILESVSDRLPADRARQYRQFSDVGEWGLLLEGICATLVKRQIPVSTSERDALASVLAIYPDPGDDHPYGNNAVETLARLHVIDETG